jgi:hypothetical protein
VSLFRKFFIWFSTPHGSSNIRKTNFVNVQIDAIAVGLANAASPFLPVFLTRLGASTIQVGLLTSMPAVAGLLFAIPFGSFLQRKSNIIPWFSSSRLGVIMGYALTGLVTFFVPPEARIIAVIFIWAILTIPQTILSIAFSVVMNSIAGPTGRFELMSRRWSILGLTTSLTVFLIGGVVSQGTFPLNYQLMFIALSVGGLISFLFSSRLEIDPSPPQEGQKKPNFLAYWQQVKGEKPFISFNVKRLVYMTGIYLATPLFPVYFVRDLHASDSMIAIISTVQTAIMTVGYFLWTRQSRKRGARLVLLATTLGLSSYPLLTAFTQDILLIPFFAAIAGIFQAGLDLVFFDELLKTIPTQYSATFVSFAQSMQYVPMIFAPLIGSALADTIGINAALLISAVVRLIGFALFFIHK